MIKKSKMPFDQKLEGKVINSKMKISKNFVYYIIAPLIALILGIILICTVGFNLGTDFTGGSTVKIYVNNESVLEATDYNLNDKEDYTEVYNKVKTILNKNGLKIVSYRTSTMDISDYKIINGQAVEIIFENKATGDKIQSENDSIRNQLLTEFGYTEYSNAISSVDKRVGHKAFNYSVEILAGIAVSLALVIIYMLIRKYRGLTFMMIMQVALDLLLLMSMILICRPVVNLTIGIAFILSFVISIINCFIFLDKIKSGNKTGKFDNLSNNEIADISIKEMFVKKSMIYIALALISVLFIAVSVPAVREIAISILLVLIVTFYTSNFVMPAIWSTLYRTKKKSIKDKKNA